MIVLLLRKKKWIWNLRQKTQQMATKDSTKVKWTSALAWPQAVKIWKKLLTMVSGICSTNYWSSLSSNGWYTEGVLDTLSNSITLLWNQIIKVCIMMKLKNGPSFRRIILIFNPICFGLMYLHLLREMLLQLQQLLLVDQLRWMPEKKVDLTHKHNLGANKFQLQIAKLGNALIFTELPLNPSNCSK